MESSEMWRTFVFVTVLTGLSTTASLTTATELSSQEATTEQQERIQALSRRGRLNSYRQLIGSGKVRAATASQANQAEAASQDAAIDLAALGFTLADVQAYRARNLDLFDVALRFFRGVTTPKEQMLLADNVVIATAGSIEESRARTDGFLSEITFTVVRTLKGSRASGDVISLPRNTGPKPNGMYQRDFSDIEFTPGKKYLLILSKNWYEQFVALGKKQTESRFTALPYLAYEVSDNGALLPGPRPTLTGAAPKDLKSVEADLKSLSHGENTAGAL